LLKLLKIYDVDFWVGQATSEVNVNAFLFSAFDISQG